METRSHATKRPTSAPIELKQHYRVPSTSKTEPCSSSDDSYYSETDSSPTDSNTLQNNGIETLFPFQMSGKWEPSPDCESVVSIVSSQPDCEFVETAVNSKQSETHRVKISRFAIVSYTYTQFEYDRTAVPMALLSDADFEEIDREHDMMTDDYEGWLRDNNDE